MVAAIHGRSLRRLRDLRLVEDLAELRLPSLRLAFPRCGPHLEQVSWLGPHTRGLTRNVSKVCTGASAACWHGLDWKIAKAIDFRALERTLVPPQLDGVRMLAIDEFAILEGHRYTTLVLDPERKRVLSVGRGRSRADVRPFFQLLGPQCCAQLRAVEMDLSTAHHLKVHMHCPNA